VSALLTVKQLAAKYHLSKSTIRARIKRGTLVPVARYPVMLFRPDALDGKPAAQPVRKAATAVEVCPVRACAMCAYRNEAGFCEERGTQIDIPQKGTCSRWVLDTWRLGRVNRARQAVDNSRTEIHRRTVPIHAS
jgi:hypothetical protein